MPTLTMGQRVDVRSVVSEISRTEDCSRTFCNDCSSDLDIDDDEEIRILGELVGGYHLNIEETGRPVHAEFKFGQKIIHRTKSVPVQNPIWTLSKKSLFFLDATPRELVHHDLEITLWTTQENPVTLNIVKKCFLGNAVLNCSEILSKCNEQLMEVTLHDKDVYDGLSEEASRGSLTLRFRLATSEDESFVHSFQKRPGLVRMANTRHLWDTVEEDNNAPLLDTHPNTGLKRNNNKRPIAPLLTEMDEAQVAGAGFVRTLSTAFSTKTFYDEKNGANKFLVKPEPDKDRINETTYMTKLELKTELFAPSKQWVETGSGTIGKLYVEILSCSNLPNRDIGEALGNLTDCFVAAVFEDAMAQTPIIYDELSPFWLPWTQRAFVFGIMHPASMLYLGAFDYDLGLSGHDPIGRVVVNISNLQRDTDYTLTYSLSERTSNGFIKSDGSITIRLRVEYKDEKEVLLAALRPRPKFHVNVHKKKSLDVVRYTCFGKYGDENDQTFDLNVFRSYIREIFEYKSTLAYCIGDAFQSLIFWRGQVEVFDTLVPMHSFLFFWAATTLVENPSLAPSFFILSIAWIMLATHTLRRQHPSPWSRCPPFWHYLEILRTGKSSMPIRRIDQNEGEKAAQIYEKEWQERLANDQKVAATLAELNNEIKNIGADDIQTKMTSVIPLDLLQRFGRWQGMIARYLRYCRFMKIILTWEEGILSFWITATFLVVGLVSLMLPWSFILLWTGRIMVWGLLGPHMKIIDLVLNNKRKNMNGLEKVIENFRKESRTARLRHQEAEKLKDLKCRNFGNYITLVPSFNLCRHYDHPLPKSFAKVHPPNFMPPIELAHHWIPGQQFFGVMIPRTLDEALTHDRQLPQLQLLCSAVERQVQRIRESMNYKLIKRLMEQYCRAQEEDMPASVGFEIISCATDSQDSTLQVPLNQASTGVSRGVTSVNIHEESNVAVLQMQTEMRRTLRRTRQSMRNSEYEMICIEDDEDDNQQLSLQLSSESSPLLMNRETSVAILETEERRMHRRKSSMWQRVVQPLESFETQEDVTEEDSEGSEAIEVVLSSHQVKSLSPISEKGTDTHGASGNTLATEVSSLSSGAGDDSLSSHIDIIYDQEDNDSSTEASNADDGDQVANLDSAHLLHYRPTAECEETS